MDFVEKAKIRLAHWISHNTHHIEEYKGFASELRKAGKLESARHIEDVIELTIKNNDCLKEALKALEE